jgi:uncharacterized protein YbaP (TraB family)
MRLVLAFALLAFACEAANAAPSCAGRDLIADLQTRDPAAYAAADAKADATPNGEGLLWRIEGAPKPSYLFGTIHLSDPRVVTLVQPVAQAFAESDRLAVEIADLAGEDGAATIAKHAMVPKGNSIADLPRDIRPQIKSALQARGIPGDAADHFEKWFLVLALAMPPCSMREMAGKSPDDVLDGSLAKAARDAGKAVIGLETSEEQILMFKSLDKDVIRRELILVPRMEPMGEDILETMTQAYLARRTALFDHALPAIAKLSKKEAEDAVYFQRAMVDDRNVTMVERAKAELDKGGLFIAVGAGHIAGHKGLVELIRKAGFTVTRVY